MRELTSESTYTITTAESVYLVTMKRLKNGMYGNPRYKARVTVLSRVWKNEFATNYHRTYVYTFNGHYYNEQDEAAWLIETLIKKDAKDAIR